MRCSCNTPRPHHERSEWWWGSFQGLEGLRQERTPGLMKWDRNGGCDTGNSSIHRQPFTEVFRGKQPIDELFIGVLDLKGREFPCVERQGQARCGGIGSRWQAKGAHHEVAVDHVTHGPVAVAVLLVPVTLASRALFHAAARPIFRSTTFQGMVFLSLDLRAFPVDAVRTDPAVDPASVVPDLKPVALDGFHQMQILLAVHLAQHDVAYLQRCRVHRLDGT